MSKLEQALEESLVRLAGGEATLEECLAQYPEHAGELRRLLAIVSKLEQGRQVRPSSAFKMRTRAQLTAHLRSHPHQPHSKPWLDGWPRGFGPALGQTLNLAFNMAAILVLVLATVTVLAQAALPGSSLYRWKVASEHVWRAVHLDPFKTDLILAGRRVTELIQVADDPQAVEVARREYQQTLATLMSEYTSPDSQKIISDTLIEQKEILDRAGVSVPELEHLLPAPILPQANLLLDNSVASVESGLITYTLTVTNAGPASPVPATLTSNLAPDEKLVSVSDAICQPSAEGVITCTFDNLTTTASHNLNITTAIDPCYVGVITQTATVTGTGNIINTNINNEAVAVTTITAPFPRSAQVAYVQSNRQTHDLGLVSSDNHLLNGILHLWAAAPAWSPDGTTLAFFGEPGISDLGGIYSQGSGVWLADMVNAQAQNPRLLVAQDHIKNIAWSPDGTQLAFEVGPPNLPHEVMIVDSTDGQIISRFSGQQPAWSPDSQQLVIKNCAP
ncbi:MAG: PD40 domain-containing protein, partial [Chloroflexi bacterium]|nr:PD40 domain-containing protein [Chloroflexota bacterium]